MQSLQINPILLGVLGTQELIVIFVIVIIIAVIILAVSKKSDPNSGSSPINSASDQNSNQHTIVVVNEGKSVGLAFLLAFFFGPLGLLYASVAGGFIMIILSIFIGVVTLGMGLIVTWIICILWAVIAAGNSRPNSTTIVTNNSSNAQPPKVEVSPKPPLHNKESLLNQLSQIHNLKEKGVLTEEVYEQEKQRILDKLSKESL